MTEKNYNPEQKNAKTSRKAENMNKNLQNNKQKIVEEPKLEVKKENTEEIKKEEIKTEPKKTEVKKEKVKKDKAIVNGVGLHISSKQSFAICKFIKYKEINFAIKELEEILLHKKPLPMKGEIPHRKGEIMSGRYPKNSIKEFIRLLKSLSANANVNEIMNPIIAEVHANFASRPYGKFGRVRKKRTNVTIIAVEKKIGEKKKK